MDSSLQSHNSSCGGNAMRQGAAQSAPTSFPSTTTRIIMLIIVNRSRLLYYSSCCKYSEFPRKKVQFFTVQVSHSYQKGVAFVGMRHLFGCFSIKILLFLWYFTKNDYAEFVSFCATSVDWKSLHSVGEQPSFVLKIR